MHVPFSYRHNHSRTIKAAAKRLPQTLATKAIKVNNGRFRLVFADQDTNILCPSAQKHLQPGLRPFIEPNQGHFQGVIKQRGIHNSFDSCCPDTILSHALTGKAACRLVMAVGRARYADHSTHASPSVKPAERP